MPKRIDPTKPFGTRHCPSCACEVDANNNRCPICQYEFPNLPGKKTARVAIAITLLALLLILLL